jgi:hypothetical protein
MQAELTLATLVRTTVTVPSDDTCNSSRLFTMGLQSLTRRVATTYSL